MDLFEIKIYINTEMYTELIITSSDLNKLYSSPIYLLGRMQGVREFGLFNSIN